MKMFEGDSNARTQPSGTGTEIDGRTISNVAAEAEG